MTRTSASIERHATSIVARRAGIRDRSWKLRVTLAVLFLSLFASAVAVVGSAGAASAVTGDTLTAGQQLAAGQSLVSSDGRFSAIMQPDGNFVVYGPGGAGWNTGGGTATHITMQTDGNLVSYNNTPTATWSSSTATSRGDRLVMQSDGNLVIYSGNNIPLWSNGNHIQNGDTLLAGQQLAIGQALYSGDARYSAIMQGDGNFVVYGPAGAGWNTGGGSATHITMQTDGNLVAYTNTPSATWWSGTSPSSNDRLVMQSDGNLVIYDGSNAALWSNGAKLGGGSYPYASVPCVYSPYATSGTGYWCSGYSWGTIRNSTAASSIYSPYGYAYRNCTDYVAWRLAADGVSATEYKGLGNANTWGTRAASHGVTNTATPSVGSAAVSTTGDFGHVAYVTAVNGSQITVSEYNYGQNGAYGTRTGTAAALGFSSFDHF